MTKDSAKKWVGAVLSLLLFGLAMMILRHELRRYSYREVVEKIRLIPQWRLLGAGGLTILNYLALTVYDALALHYIRHRLAYHKLALASFIGYVFSNNATIVGGSAARYRIYSTFGVSTEKVARLVMFCGLTYWLGLFALAGAVFVAEPRAVPPTVPLPFGSVRPIGLIFLAVVTVYLGLVLVRRKPLRIRRWEFTLPPMGISAAQIAVSGLDWLLAASVFYVLLPAKTDLPFAHFMALFMVAQTVGFLSHVPGGLGVFEGLILLLLEGTAEPTALLGTLVVYRLIYYLAPLAIAVVLLGGHEIAHRARLYKRWALALRRWRRQPCGRDKTRIE